MASRIRKKRGWLVVIWLTLGIVLLFFFSSVPASLLVRLAFRNDSSVAPDGYAQMQTEVAAHKNLRYPSQLGGNEVDLYLPNDKEGPLPVILWVHGGAFVGGSKDGIETYATALASEGFAVACMNYLRAPEAKYPSPLRQVMEMCLWLKEVAATYSLDTDRLVLAGDSAGAHITAQFAAVQTNEDYALEMGMAQGFSPKAVLLFCGPYDVAKIAGGSHPLINFFMDKAAHAYFGTRDWVGRFARQATIANHVTAAFPPAFISDGNTGSFEKHARELAEVLEEKGVAVETYFIPLEKEKTPHEYQFIMNTDAGRESFIRTVAFLRGAL
jgi:Esterase/lipase